MSDEKTRLQQSGKDTDEAKKEIRVALWVEGKMLVKAASEVEAVDKAGIVGRPSLINFRKEGLAARTTSWELAVWGSPQWRITDTVEQEKGLFAVHAKYAFLGRFFAKVSTPLDLIEEALKGISYQVRCFERKFDDVDVSDFVEAKERYRNVQILGEVYPDVAQSLDERNEDAPSDDGPNC